MEIIAFYFYKIIKNNNYIYKRIKIYNNKNEIIYQIMIKLILLIIINIFLANTKSTSTNDIYENNFVTDINLFNQINKFVDLCRNGTLINGIHNCSKNIKISVIIPVFNSSKDIKPTIRSIQNQKLKDFEILLIDDCSLDDTIKHIEELKKEDSRIKLIKNNKNRGTLYSRSIGALNSNGKYIMSIDNDDIFINDIFNKCYNEAENNRIDIIEFSGFELETTFINISLTPMVPLYLRFKSNDKIIYQPELSNYIYQKKDGNYKLIDAYIWGKCIKTIIYKKALNIIGKNIYSQNVCWSEDRLVNFVLFRVGNSFKYINIYGIIHYLNPSSVGNTWQKENNNRISHDEIINIINIFKITKDSKDVNIAAYELQRKFDLIFSGLTKTNIKYCKYIFYNIINCKYITKKRKKKLIELYKNIFFN